MRQRLNLALVLGIAATIFYFSVRPIPAPAYDAGFNTTLLYHAAAYFAFAAALLLYFHDTPRGHVEAILTATLFGATMELLQFFITNRVFSVIDITANTLGAGLVLLDHRSRLVTSVIATEDRMIDRLIPGDHLDER